MNILLTGGTGLIGNALTRHLIDKGYKVSILTREVDVDFFIFFDLKLSKIEHKNNYNF